MTETSFELGIPSIIGNFLSKFSLTTSFPKNIDWCQTCIMKAKIKKKKTIIIVAHGKIRRIKIGLI